MQRWEYLEEQKKATGDLHAHLKEKGDAGWELCVFTGYPGRPGELLLIFKRPVETKGEPYFKGIDMSKVVVK